MVLEHVNALAIEGRPGVKIFLVPESFWFAAVITPFQDLLLPQGTNFLCLFRCVHSQELDAEAAYDLAFVIFGIEIVLSNQNRSFRLLELRQERSRRTEKIQIRVDKCHSFRSRATLEDRVERKGGQSPAVFPRAAVRLGRKEPRILNLPKGDSPDVRHVQNGQAALDLFVHAEDPKLPFRAMFAKRFSEGETLRQEVRIQKRDKALI